MADATFEAARELALANRDRFAELKFTLYDQIIRDPELKRSALPCCVACVLLDHINVYVRGTKAGCAWMSHQFLAAELGVSRRVIIRSVAILEARVRPAASYDPVSLSPKSVSASSTFSRKMLLQSSPDIEQLLRDDLREQVALAIDLAAIAGSEAGDEPTDILNTAGIGDVDSGTDGGPITWDSVVELSSDVSVGNAAIGNLAYLTDHTVAGKMRVTPRQSTGVEGNFTLPAEASDRLDARIVQ